MLNTKNLETIKDLLIKYASAEVLAKAILQYMDDIEPNLDDNNVLNQFYVMDNTESNFQLLMNEFEINTYKQIELTYNCTCEYDNFIQPMKYLTKDNKYIWIIRGLSKKYYYKIINNNRNKIIAELLKHYVYINWNEAIIDILEGDIIND